MKEFLIRLQEEYEKLACPICGSKPRIVPLYGNKFNTETCAHEEIEILIEEAERKLLDEQQPLTSSKRYIVPKIHINKRG